MKLKNIFQTIFFLLLLSFVVQSKPQVVLAQEYWCKDGCYTGQYTCQDNDCEGCLFCPTPVIPARPELTDVPEDITGKIYNRALPIKINTISGVNFLRRFLQTGIKFGFFVGSIIFFFLLLIGAIKWISSSGDKARLEGAQKQITHALVGLVILLSIFAIISVIESIFGISITNISLPTL